MCSFLTFQISYFSIHLFVRLLIHPSFFHSPYVLTTYLSTLLTYIHTYLLASFLFHFNPSYNFDPLSIGIPRCAIADLKGKNSIALNFHHLFNYLVTVELFKKNSKSFESLQRFTLSLICINSNNCPSYTLYFLPPSHIFSTLVSMKVVMLMRTHRR